MTNEYNTWTKKEAVVSNEALAKVEENIISTINCLKEEIINLKDIVTKRLQEENKKLQEKCSKLENDVISNESSVNALEQYGRRNNIVYSGISVFSDIEGNVSPNDVEACHRTGKPDGNKSKKTMVHFLNWRHCKKALLNRGKLQNLDKEKHSFSQNTKVFINENLTMINEALPSMTEN